jgi:hypothetical protein
MNEQHTLVPEEILDQAIARNEASIFRIQTRIKEILEELDHMAQDREELPAT